MAFLPQTRKAMEYFREGNEPEQALAMMDDDQPSHADNAEILQLKLKRRYRMQLIKQMLQDAGYGDLAQMTQVKAERGY